MNNWILVLVYKNVRYPIKIYFPEPPDYYQFREEWFKLDHIHSVKNIAYYSHQDKDIKLQ